MGLSSATITDSKAQWELVKSKQKLWLFPLLAAFFIIGSLFVVLLPQVRTITEVRKQMKADKERLARLVAKREFLNGLPEAELNQQLQLVSRVLPNDKPVFQAIGVLMKRTELAQVQLLDYGLAPGLVASESAKHEEVADTPGVLTPLPMTFSVTGPFDNVYQLLANLDQTAPLARITSLTMSGFGEDAVQNHQPDSTVKLQAQVYYALPPKEMGSVSEPLPELSPDQKNILADLFKYETAEIDMTGMAVGVNELKPNPFAF